MHQDFCTYVHDKCEFKGTFFFEGITRIDGKITGQVYSHHVLIVGPSGVIEGDVHVGTLIVYGVVRGDVRASERVEARGEAKVFANILSPVVQFAEGVHFDGKIQMHAEDKSVASFGV